MQPLQCAVVVVGPELGAAAGKLRVRFVVIAVLPVCGDFQKRRQHSATTAHRALPVCECPALGMSRGTVRSDAAFDFCNRGGGTCTGACGRAVQVVH